MKYVKLFEDYYGSEHLKSYHYVPSDEELEEWEYQAMNDRSDETFIENILILNVDEMRYLEKNYGYVDGIQVGPDFGDYVKSFSVKKNGYYTWYKDFGTPLHYLVSLKTDSEEKESRRYQMIDLLDSYCGINLQDINGNTPLHIVAMKDVNDIKAMKILLSSGSFGFDTKNLEIKNNEGMTPLDLASPEMKKTIYIALGQDNDDDGFDY